MSSHSVGIRRAVCADDAALIQLNAELLPKPHCYSQWQERLPAGDVFAYLAGDEAIFGFVTAGPALLLAADVGEVCGLFLSTHAVLSTQARLTELSQTFSRHC